MNMHTRLCSIALVAALTAPVFTAKAAVGPWDEVISSSQKVNVSDLDLSTPDGRDEARHRIERVARKICKSLQPTIPGNLIGHSRCLGTAVRQAMLQLPDPLRDPRQWLAAGRHERDARK